MRIGIIVVYDVTDQESFNNVKQWMNEIDRYANEKAVQRLHECMQVYLFVCICVMHMTLSRLFRLCGCACAVVVCLRFQVLETKKETGRERVSERECVCVRERERERERESIHQNVLRDIKMWLTHNIHARYANEKVNKMLVGNKCDLTSKKVVNMDDAKAYAETIGIPFLETSAKDSTNVEQAFITMAAEIKARMAQVCRHACIVHLVHDNLNWYRSAYFVCVLLTSVFVCVHGGLVRALALSCAAFAFRCVCLYV